jgi:hypothetical protein
MAKIKSFIHVSAFCYSGGKRNDFKKDIGLEWCEK